MVQQEERHELELIWKFEIGFVVFYDAVQYPAVRVGSAAVDGGGDRRGFVQIEIMRVEIAFRRIPRKRRKEKEEGGQKVTSSRNFGCPA